MLIYDYERRIVQDRYNINAKHVSIVRFQRKMLPFDEKGLMEKLHEKKSIWAKPWETA